MLSKNSVDLLFILNKKESCTLDYLSMKLNLSKNSVLNLLDELDEYLKEIPESDVHLSRKSGDGIRLIDNFQEMNTVLVKLSRHYTLSDQGIYDGRCIQAILILLNEKDYLTLQDLADKVYVSKGTIINDLDLVEKILAMYHIDLIRVRNRGIKIDGKEADVRKLFSDIVNGKVNKAPIQVLAYDNINSLYSLFNKEYVDRVHDLIIEMINEDIELSNIQISAVLVHVMIAIQRIKSGESLKMAEENLRKIESTKYFEISEKFTNEVEKIVGLSFDKDEIGYIALHLMCSKQVLQIYDLAKEEYRVIDEHLKQVVQTIVQIISQETNNHSIEDRELIDGLILHLKPAIERMRNNLSTKNPYLSEIKKNYLPAFDIAIKINEILDREYGVGYDENEIAYIALHVQAHVERFHNRSGNQQRVAVVCATGIGTSQLLMARLKNYFDKDVKFTALGVNEIQDINVQNKYDLILTTIPLELERKVIYLDPFFSDNQLKKISELLYSIPSDKQHNTQKTSVFNPNLIHLSNDFEKREDVLKFICTELETSGRVKNGFKESVFRREKIASTAYGNFAIPHGDVELVDNSCIYLYISKKGIKWDDKTVHVIFLIALNKDKHSEFGKIFNDLYEIVSDKNKLKQLTDSESENEAYRLMIGEL